MATYCIGDIQGCFDDLQALLRELDFDQSRDRLWFTGDLVNRGPGSLEVLRFVRSLGDRAVVVLGNHDIHLLAVWAGLARLKSNDTLQPVLEADDVDALMDWLRTRPLLHADPELGFALCHAGIHPAWDLAQAKARAREVESALAGEGYRDFLSHLYGNEPAHWNEDLEGWPRLRFITNAFTRMRYCAADGRLVLDYKGPVGTQPPGYYPWFEVPDRAPLPEDTTIITGHWSTLGYRAEIGLLAIDTGCLWGGQLTAVSLDSARQRYCVECRGAQRPGA